MMSLYTFLSSFLLIGSVFSSQFPKDFLFGAGTSSYQTEGAKEGIKGENIWDKYEHSNNNLTVDGSNADLACDSYHKYNDDIAVAKEIGLNYFRLSISWSRIFLNGFYNKSENYSENDGIKYYRKLLRGLKSAGIEPMVTLYHWDLPQSLQDLGGWTNPLIVGWYSDYATVCFKMLGDLIKMWSTFNEPYQVCHAGYSTTGKAPGILSPGIGEYLCTHYLLLSHAEAVQIYRDDFQKKQNGIISIVMDIAWSEPFDPNSDSDKDAAQRFKEFYYGWYANPVVYGDYPKVMKDYIGEKSKTQGFKKSRLPEFTLAEKIKLRGSFDFLGVNHYTCVLAENVNLTDVSLYGDMNVNISFDPKWNRTLMADFVNEPWSLNKTLVWIMKTYKNPVMYVTENGIADDGKLDDVERENYLKGYIRATMDAISLGAKVKGYTYWSLLDNWEWLNGYTMHFGLVQVDRSNSNLTRTIKRSGYYYKKIINNRSLDF